MPFSDTITSSLEDAFSAMLNQSDIDKHQK